MTRHPRHHRRGISTLWVILTLPVFLTLLVFSVDIANLWLARVELENGLEAAALAAVTEWGRSTNPADTANARNVGRLYALANRVRGVPLEISTSYSTAAVNQNAACCPAAGPPPTGNLVFGAVGEISGVTTFNAGEVPGCGDGNVLFDVTGNSLTDPSAWGIAFLSAQDPASPLTIQSITIDLQGGVAGASGIFTGASPAVSDRVVGGSTPPIIPCQDDTVGVDPGQIVFTYLDNHTLQITFNPATVFEPGDRFRFSAGISGVGPGGSEQDDGDGVGADRVLITVVFAVNGVAQPAVSTRYVDTQTKSNQCIGCGLHPSGIPNLPCPQTSSAQNDGQAYVVLSGSGANDFGVRAQAIMPVRSLVGGLFGDCFGTFQVTARATARYNCTNDRAWLVEVEDFICP